MGSLLTAVLSLLFALNSKVLDDGRGKGARYSISEELLGSSSPFHVQGTLPGLVIVLKKKNTVCVFKAQYCDQNLLLGFRKVSSMTEDCEYISQSNKHSRQF